MTQEPQQDAPSAEPEYCDLIDFLLELKAEREAREAQA